MGTLTAGQIFGICLDAGFTRDQAVTWTAIALAESGGDPAAHNPHGEDSWGLWQINVDPAVRPNRWGDLTDPVINARAAYEVSRGGTDLRPWTVTHDSNAGTDRDYRNFMDEARAAAGGGELGDFSGVRGADEAPPAPGDDPAAPAAPAPAPAPAPDDPDTDLDGATDAFEMAHGTDPLLPDSDADGLTDGFELTHGLDATTFDTDGDGLSDRHEVRVGSDAASFDTDGDGVVDAVELAVGRDPRHGLAPGTAAGDQDDDGLSDAWEAAIGTDPTTGDSDGDGVADGV
ncbi:MAG TPA: transglycosylase SLT domain-containing protein, partial [Acidimicrobiales bacterium]